MSETIEPLPPRPPSLSEPRLGRPAVRQAGLDARTAPAILRVSRAGEMTQAEALGFNFVLVRTADFAGAAALPVLLELALDRPDEAMLEAHPEWVVHGEDGPALRFLSDRDETVDWWDARLEGLQEAGFAGFYLREAARVPGPVWRRLVGLARERDAAVLFIAELFGAAPAALEELANAGFSFATSSSCYWDFTSGWLNADSGRVERVAPAVALAVPPGPAGCATAVLRGLRFSAAFAPAWLVDAAVLRPEFSDEIRALNALRREVPALQNSAAARLCSSPGRPLAVLSRAEAFVMVANGSLAQGARMPAAAMLPPLGQGRLRPLRSDAAHLTAASEIELAEGEIEYFEILQTAPVFWPVAPLLDCDAPRLAIEAITPQVDDGRFPVRRNVGELVRVEADLIADGHDKIAGDVLVRAADEAEFRAYPMQLINNDRWFAEIPLERMGRHVVHVTAWKDAFASFVDEVTKKHAAGVPTALELQEGLALVDEAAAEDEGFRAVVTQLRGLDETALREALLNPKMAEAMRMAAPRKFLVRSHAVALDAERKAASFASWYEIFPRSQSGDARRHGTLRDVIRQLPRIAAMGFDVLYFPPIHPIGEKNRKGKNNTLRAGPDDPGSPYAIGSAAGGHDALHPELGGFEDFRALVAAAAEHGMELALDFAIQCAPDHPWLREHKEWFDWRPDGSLRYAENPPKKYEDIVNVDFYAEGAKPALWLALRDVVQFWVDQGVKIFRVDNPHTKPFPFWEWMIADIRSRHADAIFLAEAFTRPKIMYRLAKIGFSQSYTYFTWRNTKPELEEYLNELTASPPREYFRPNFFVNTPDINPPFLQHSGRGGFLIRAALAATLSGLWGVYNGFELCEAEPVPGKEEYLNSEKYEIKAWDYDRPGNIVAEIAELNRVRRENMALHSHLNVEFLPCNNPFVLYFRKFAADGNVILAAISLDPHHVQDAVIELPLWRFGIADDGALAAEDVVRDFGFVWHGKYQTVRLDPSDKPYCIWRVGPVGGLG